MALIVQAVIRLASGQLDRYSVKGTDRTSFFNVLYIMRIAFILSAGGCSVGVFLCDLVNRV